MGDAAAGLTSRVTGVPPAEELVAMVRRAEPDVILLGEPMQSRTF